MQTNWRLPDRSGFKWDIPNRLIILIYLLLTYSGGWWALLGSFLILLVAWLAWRDHWIDHIGFQVSRSQIWLAVISLVIAIGVAWAVIPVACQTQGITLTPVWQRDNPLYHILHTIGQTFNEEIVLGWLLLTTLRKKFPHLSNQTLAFLVALIFAGMHFAFFAARPAGYSNYGILSVASLLSVFAAGVLRSNLILGSGVIILAWAVHLGWNLVFIDSSFTWSAIGNKLSEPEIFNAVFGYLPIMIIFAILMAVSQLFYRSNGYELGNNVFIRH